MTTPSLSLSITLLFAVAVHAAAAQSEVQSPAYTIVEKKDLSLGAVHRFNVRVRLAQHYSRAEVERIAHAIVADLTKTERINALSMMFYSPGGTVTSAWDVAVIDWAPQGRWEDAATVRSGDYSSFGYTVTYRPPPARADTGSTLKVSRAKGLHGTPLPLGARLVASGSDDPRSGRSRWEQYSISASAKDISAYFSREMAKAGWLRDNLSSANELFLNRGSAQLDILINAKGGTFLLSGS